MNKKLFFLSHLITQLLCATSYVKRPLPPLAEQGMPVKEDQLPAAYNSAARVNIDRGWDFFFMGSYLYWYVEQEGMEIALPSQGRIDYMTPSVTLATINGDSFIRSDFVYSPGFKAGLGIGFDGDNWMGVLEYTWMHQKVSTSPITQGELMISPGTVSSNFLALTSWFTAYRGVAPFPPAVSVASKWHMHMDLGDAYLARPFYQGRYITVTPFAGLRGAWIRQNFRVTATVPSIPQIFSLQTLVSRNYSHSWGVGPRIGMKGHWLLGAGFRLEGDASGSLLFTRYTKVSHVETTDVPSALSYPHYRFHNYQTLRPIVDLGLGIGWGSYLGWCRKPSAYIDLSGNYDLLMFWGQNMMEKLVNNYATLTDASAGDLHMHGVTATLSLDF